MSATYPELKEAGDLAIAHCAKMIFRLAEKIHAGECPDRGTVTTLVFLAESLIEKVHPEVTHDHA